jgi:cyclopropane fatty-acyl-phospholipid synthase-like methyltransferase
MLRKVWFNLAYLSKPVWDTGISPPELLHFIDNHTPGRALDLGCGTGTNAITLAKKGWRVSGVDFSKRAIQNAQKKAQQNDLHIDFFLGDVTRLKINKGRFDLVLDIGCFHSLPSNKRVAYIQKIDQLLSDDGTFLLYLFIKPRPDTIGPGVSDQDIQLLNETFHVADRVDSTERGLRPSAWFTLNKQA